MRSTKTIVAVGFFSALALSFFATGTVFASDATTTVVTPIAEAATTGDCTLNVADFAKIAAIQSDPTLSYLDEIKQELVVRKDIVGQTITCAKADAQSLQESLNAATTTISAAADIQSRLSGRLDDAQNFYTNELTKLDSAGIAGTQQIAAEVLAWRDGSYEPLNGQVNNFILWSENQGLFTTAADRMQKTSQAVSFLEGASGNSDLENAFSAAQGSFNAAQEENNNAENAIVQLLPPDQQLSIIKGSLDSLSDTYQKLFDVTTIINTLLSH